MKGPYKKEAGGKSQRKRRDDGRGGSELEIFAGTTRPALKMEKRATSQGM